MRKNDENSYFCQFEKITSQFWQKEQILNFFLNQIFTLLLYEWAQQMLK